MGYGSMPPLSCKSALKFTIDGRPTVNDIHDYFSFLVSQITFTTHKYMFRSYPFTFTSEDAISRLGSLNISHDPNSKTNLKLGKDMAKALIQQFLWSRLIEYAVDPHNRSYRDKGIWRLKSKGLCVLQDFCLKSNRVDLLSFFKNCVHKPSTDPMFLIHIERMVENDRMIRKRKHISSLFAIMVASLPFHDDSSLKYREGDVESQSLIQENYPKKFALHDTPFVDYKNCNEFDLYSTFTDKKLSRQSSISSASTNFTSTSSLESSLITDYFPHLKIYANDLLVHNSSLQKPVTSSLQQKVLLRNLRPSSSNKFKMRSIFTSLLCCEWLIGCCTIASNDEAESIMTEFLDLGWITFFDEKNKNKREIESSKSIMLKLTGTGMKIIIDFSLESYENFQQQNLKDEAAYATSLEGKRYSIASHSSSSNQTESTTFSRLEEPFFSKQSHLPSIKSTNTTRSNSLAAAPSKNNNKSSITHENNPKKSYQGMAYPSNNSTPYNDECITNQPVFVNYFHCNNTIPLFTPSGNDKISNDSCKENNSIKLKAILNDTNLRSLFRDFLRVNLCTENLDFWIDHQKLRSECHDSLQSLVVLSPKKQQVLIKDAYILWNTYLAPDASRELNIDHTLREDMAEEMSCIATVVNTGGIGTSNVPTVIISMHSAYESLLTIFAWFEKVDDQICKLMASDSIPKFIRTVQYKKIAGDRCSFQEIEEKRPTTPIASIANNDELDYFPPPPQRKLKETLFL